MTGRVLIVLCAALIVTGLVSSPIAASAEASSGSLTWHRPQPTDPDRGLLSVSCVAKDLCRAGATPNLVKRWDGQQWKAGDAFPSRTRGIRAMTCTSRTFCAAVQVVYRPGSQDYAYRPITRRADGTWDLSAPLVPVGAANPLFPPGSVSCAGASLCMLVNRYREFQRWDGTSWTPPTLFSDQAVGTYVLCPSATLRLTRTTRPIPGTGRGGPIRVRSTSR